MQDEDGNDNHLVPPTMRWIVSVCLSPGSWMLLLLVLWTAACGNDAPTPSITFTKIPPAARAGPDVLDTIEGRVTGVRPGQHLVIYNRSSIWWVQPSPNTPFAEIREDSTFSVRTHLGTEYAALLVDPTHQPPATLENLPPEGGSVVRLVVVPGDPKAKPVRHTLQFGGYSGPFARRPAIAVGTTSTIRPMPGRMATARCICASPASLGNGRAPS